MKKIRFELTVEVKNDHDEFLLGQAVQRAWFDWQATQPLIKSVSVLPARSAEKLNRAASTNKQSTPCCKNCGEPMQLSCMNRRCDWSPCT